jgi:hypothetical protein
MSLLRTVAQVTISMTGGDLVCQALEANRAKEQQPEVSDTLESGSHASWWDPRRSRRMAVTGLFVQGPWSHLQYQLLEVVAAGTSNRAVLTKVAIGAITAPLSISMTFSSIGLQKGHTFQQIKEKIQRDVPDTWMTGACYWPFIMTMNFKFVSLANRPLVGSLAGSFWSVYMAYQANKKSKGEEQDGNGEAKG